MPGSPMDGVLARIVKMLEQSRVAIDAGIDIIRTKAADPRPSLRGIASTLRNLSGEAAYQAERAEKIIAEYDERLGG